MSHECKVPNDPTLLNGINIVEVMDTETHQWFTAADLPEPLSHSSVIVSEDQLYVLGGHAGFKPTKSVYTCSVSNLLQSAKSILSRASRNSMLVWCLVADLPYAYPSSTCAFFNGRLLAIGGQIDQEKKEASTAVYMYDSTTNSWDIISYTA